MYWRIQEFNLKERPGKKIQEKRGDENTKIYNQGKKYFKYIVTKKPKNGNEQKIWLLRI